MEQTNSLFYDIGFYLRYVSFGVIFLWAFYRAFVTEYTVKRFAFAMLTFTTVAVAIFAYERPVNLSSLAFIGNIGVICIIDLIVETRKLRFWEAFRRSKKKITDYIHLTKN